MIKDLLNDERTPVEQRQINAERALQTFRVWGQTERNFAVQSTQMTEKWHNFEQDGDRYLLQYRTADDEKVRAEHASLHGVTLPMDDPFWDEYYPPLGWNCRCTAVQVRKDKYPVSDSTTAMQAGEKATESKKQQIFRFNPGKQGKVFPPKHPYLPKGCEGCDKNKLRLGFSSITVQCQTCSMVTKCWHDQQKTEQARERIHYLHEMEPLLAKKVIVNGNGHPITVKFNKLGNKHLFSDTFGRTRTLQKEDLKDLDKLLANATFVKKVGLSKPRRDDIKRFYYYKATLRGETVYLNVAEESTLLSSGQIKHDRFLYSITDNIR